MDISTKPTKRVSFSEAEPERFYPEMTEVEKDPWSNFYDYRFAML